MTTTTDTARRYVETVGAHDLRALDTLLDDDLVAIVGQDTFGKAEWIGALTSFLPALDHYAVHDVLTEGDRAVVVYDFVSPTRSVPCVEVLTVADGRIRAIRLVFDSLHWGEVLATAATPAWTSRCDDEDLYPPSATPRPPTGSAQKYGVPR